MYVLTSGFFADRYILLQGLAGVAGGFLQIVPLIIYYVKLILLGSTPRSVWSIKYLPRHVAWGTTFPGITLLVVIGEPLSLGFRNKTLTFVLQPLVIQSSRQLSTVSHAQPFSCSTSSTNISSFTPINNPPPPILAVSSTPKPSNTSSSGYTYSSSASLHCSSSHKTIKANRAASLRVRLWWCS